VRIYDAGDVLPAKGGDTMALNETHRYVTEAAKKFHDEGLIVVGIGGGHDLTYPMVRALSGVADEPMGGINIDPHLDVRETPGSGMPYRRLIEEGFVDPKRFVEFGTGRFDNSRAHVEWLREQGGTITDISMARNDPSAIDNAFRTAFEQGDGFVSIDMDVIEGVHGVSAVPAFGLPIDPVLEFARRAGEHTRVRHFDLMELSPTHDIGNRTARIAVLLFQTFVAGVQKRE